MSAIPDLLVKNLTVPALFDALRPTEDRADEFECVRVTTACLCW
jgi:hypothetical protein